MSKIANDGFRSGIQLYPYGNSGRQTVNDLTFCFANRIVLLGDLKQGTVTSLSRRSRPMPVTFNKEPAS